MARMGGKKQLKRLAAPASWKIPRKSRHGVWITNVVPGPHPKERSIPLRVLIRDYLKLADNTREADYIIKSGKVLVDGKVSKEPRFPVGLFDVVEIPDLGKVFRIVLDEKGRVTPKEVPEEEKNVKLVRVERKQMIKGGRIQIGTHDGRTFVVDDNSIRPGDALKISVPEQRILERYPLDKGSLVYVLSGRHAGTLGIVDEVIPGTLLTERSVKISVEGATITTPIRNVFVVGTKTPAITL